MENLSASEIEDIKEVFDLYDFWDGRDGLVDGYKVGDLLRCLALNPTNGFIQKIGGNEDKQYALEDILPLYQVTLNEKDTGTMGDFVEAFKSFDREGQGYVSAAEIRYVLSNLGEKLQEADVEKIMQQTETYEDVDGNIKYEDFIKRVMAGPKSK